MNEDGYTHASRLHREAARLDPRDQRQHIPTTTQTVLDAFVRKLADLNRRNLLAGATTDVQCTDPRDIAVHAHALAEGIVIAGSVPGMDLVDALGAQVLALALSVARVEDQSAHLGDAA